MKGSFSLYLLLTALLNWLCACTPSASKPETLRIATAANMQFAMQALADTFSAQTGHTMEIIVGSSGKLKAQIQEGAPYDIFVSADTRYPERLYQDGIGALAPQVYAYGQLVLWTLSPDLPLQIDSLMGTKIKHIALANPKLAPYGAATRQLLKDAGLWNALQNRLIRAESISQTNQFILSGGAEVGFTALAAVHTPHQHPKGRWVQLDTASYPPIAQAVLLLNDAPVPKSCYDFLFSASARGILAAHGYTLPVD